MDKRVEEAAKHAAAQAIKDMKYERLKRKVAELEQQQARQQYWQSGQH